MQIWWKFDDSSSDLLQVIVQTNTNFLEFLNKMVKMTLKVKLNDPHFQYNSWEYPMMHVWCKFGDSNWNLWWVLVIVRTK